MKMSNKVLRQKIKEKAFYTDYNRECQVIMLPTLLELLDEQDKELRKRLVKSPNKPTYRFKMANDLIKEILEE